MMKRLMLSGATAAAMAAVAVLALPVSASADTIVSLGVNPTSGTGAFANTNPGTGGGGSGAFTDLYTFSLLGGPQFVTIASVTNTYASAAQFIANFTGSVVYDGPNGVPGGGDDVVVIGPVAATACLLVPNCQSLAGSAILTSGNYYLSLTGIAGVDAGYGGNLSTAAVAIPGPIAGAGLPGLVAACFGLAGLGWRRRRRNAAAA